MKELEVKITSGPCFSFPTIRYTISIYRNGELLTRGVAKNFEDALNSAINKVWKMAKEVYEVSDNRRS